MQTLATLARHAVTYGVGILTAWLTLYLTEPAELKAATDAASALIEPLVILSGFVAVILSRLAMPFLTNLFRRGAGEKGDSGGGLNLLGLVGILMIGTAAVGTLPSCSPTDEYPLTASISFRDPQSGAKAGLTYTPRFVRVLAEK